MTPSRAPAPVKRSVVSPSAAAGLLSCPLQLAYRDDPVLGDVPSTPALRIGAAAHDLLEQAAAGRLDGPGGVRGAWDAAIARQAAEAAADPRAAGWPRDPRRWPFYSLKRARAIRLATSLSRFSRPDEDAAPRPAAIRLEQVGEALHGRLRGRIDVVRLGPPKVIEDYKTGAVADAGTGEVKDEYRVQMLLYALLEHERDGVWPERAILIPVHGSAVEIEIDPGAVTAVARQLLTALDAYLAAGTGDVLWALAAPQPAVCARCPFAVHCAPFWDACDETWSEAGAAAASGRVTGVSGDGGSLSLVIESVAGTHAGQLAVRGLHGSHVAHLGGVKTGDVIGLTGFVPSRNPQEARGSYVTRIEQAAQSA